MECLRCGRELTRAGNFLVCGECGLVVPRVEDGLATSTDNLQALIPQLPHPLALLLQEYVAEQDPYIKLHRMCDSAEMLVRFLVAITLAEVHRHRDGGLSTAPDQLRRALLNGLERPTFGVWLGLLNAGQNAIHPESEVLVPVLPRMTAAVNDLLSPPRGTVENALLPLRNRMAHDSRFSETQSRHYLDDCGHRQRFEELWLSREAAFLSDFELVGVSPQQEYVALQGAAIPPTGTFVTHSRCVKETTWPAGTVLLVNKNRDDCMTLFPLQVYDVVRSRRGGRPEEVDPDTRVSQIYSRSDDFIPQYTALHRHLGSSDGNDALREAFTQLFPLREWRTSEAEEKRAAMMRDKTAAATASFRFRDFWERYRAEPFLGREEHLCEALRHLERRDSGVALILGRPGMGKTAFALHLSNRLKASYPRWLCLRHFFRADDSRCSRRAFLLGVLYQLAAAELPTGAETDPAGTTNLTKLDDRDLADRFLAALDRISREFLSRTNKPDNQFSRLVLILDGLDEIAQSDGSILELIQKKDLKNVLWLCVGRPDESLLTGLQQAKPIIFTCKLPQGDGGTATESVRELPALDRCAVREFLVTELERDRYALLKDEAEADRFLDYLSTRVESLPLYLRLLIDDLRRGRFQVDHPHELPADLSAYYDQLIDRMRLDSARDVLQTYISLLAVAHTPLPTATLKSLLEDHHLASDPDWERVFQQALQLGHVLTRRAYVWEGETGHTLYHQSFQDHLLAMERTSYDSDGASLGPSIRDSRRRLIKFCQNWRKWPEGSYQRAYAIRYGPQHLIMAAVLARRTDGEPQAWDEVVRLLTDIEFVEAKVRMGQVFELVDDYRSACKGLPEAEAVIRRNRMLDMRRERWVRELTDYARQWSERRDRQASGVEVEVAEPTFPEIIPSVTPRPQSDLEEECRRAEEMPNRLDRLQAFASFVQAERHPLAEFGNQSGFLVQHALACLPGGPVHHAARRLAEQLERPWLERRWETGAAYVPKPASIETFQTGSLVSMVKLIGEGHQAISVGLPDGVLKFWDLRDGRCLQTITTGHKVSEVAASINGRLAVTVGEDQCVRVWDLQHASCRYTLEYQPRLINGVRYLGISSVDLSADGRYAVTGAHDGVLQLWNLSDGTLSRTLIVHDDSVNSVRITPESRLALTASRDTTLRLWNLATGECLHVLEGHTSDTVTAAMTPDGRTAVSIDDEDATLHVWDLTTGQCRRTIAIDMKYGSGVDVTPDGMMAITGGSRISAWDLNTGRCLRSLMISDVATLVTELTPDGRCAISSGVGPLRMWDIESGSSPAHPLYPVSALDRLPDGRMAVLACIDGGLRIWDTTTGQCGREIQCSGKLTQELMLTQDGSRAAVTWEEGSVQVVDLESGNCDVTIKDTSKITSRGQLIAEDRRIVCGCEDGMLRIWDLTDGRCLRAFGKHGTDVNSVAITPDGQRLVSCSGFSKRDAERDNSLRMWDLHSGTCLKTMPGIGALRQVCITPDGRRAVTCSFDSQGEENSLEIWDLPRATCLRKMKGHSGPIWKVKVTADGQLAVSASWDHSLRVWELASGDSMVVYCSSGQLWDLVVGSTTEDILCAGASGDVVVLKLRNFRAGPTVVTISRSFDNKDDGPLEHWVRCPNCMMRFVPSSKLIDLVNVFISDLSPGQSACLELPSETYDEPQLFVECPKCGESLKINPFFLDVGPDVADLFNDGKAAYVGDDFELAYALYGAAIKRSPRIVEAYFNRGLALTRLRRYQEAEDDIRRVIQLSPDLGEGYFTLGLIFEYQERNQEAIVCYDRVLEIDPNDERAAKHRDRAIEYLRRRSD